MKITEIRTNETQQTNNSNSVGGGACNSSTEQPSPQVSQDHGSQLQDLTQNQRVLQQQESAMYGAIDAVIRSNNQTYEQFVGSFTHLTPDDINAGLQRVSEPTNPPVDTRLIPPSNSVAGILLNETGQPSNTEQVAPQHEEDVLEEEVLARGVTIPSFMTRDTSCGSKIKLDNFVENEGSTLASPTESDDEDLGLVESGYSASFATKSVQEKSDDTKAAKELKNKALQASVGEVGLQACSAQASGFTAQEELDEDDVPTVVARVLDDGTLVIPEDDNEKGLFDTEIKVPGKKIKASGTPRTIDEGSMIIPNREGNYTIHSPANEENDLRASTTPRTIDEGSIIIPNREGDCVTESPAIEENDSDVDDIDDSSILLPDESNGTAKCIRPDLRNCTSEEDTYDLESKIEPRPQKIHSTEDCEDDEISDELQTMLNLSNGLNPGEIENEEEGNSQKKNVRLLEYSARHANTEIGEIASRLTNVQMDTTDDVQTDEVQSFSLDEDFDYDNVILTPKFTTDEMQYLRECSQRGAQGDETVQPPV